MWDGSRWVKHLKDVELFLRTCPNRTTGQSAYQMLMGYQPRLHVTPNVEEDGNAVQEDVTRGSHVLVNRWSAIDKSIANQRKRTQIENGRADDLKIGDQVWLYDSAIDKQFSRKFDARWLGPYRIMGKSANNIYTIKKFDSNRKLKAHRFLLKRAFLREQ